jgi:ACS family hexuronate transporter-like MFS transporter
MANSIPEQLAPDQPAPGRAPARVGHYRWLVCALLFLATTINYMDRQILSLLKPLLDTELGWTNEQFGQINAAFQAAYAVGLLLFGAFIDRFGTRIGYAISLLAWSLAALSHAAVRSVSGFVAARAALGVGEGGNFPSAIKAVALWFPARERAFATALFNAGSNVGAIIAPAVIPWLALTWGWRSAFVAAAAAGLVWMVLWLPLYDVPEKVPRLSRSELTHIQSDRDDHSTPRRRAAWVRILATRQAWAFIAAKFLTDPVWWFFLIWLPDYFKKAQGLDLKGSWMHLVAIYSIVTVLSVAGGWVTGALARGGRDLRRARKMAMLLFAFLVVPIVMVGRASGWTAVCLIGLAGAAHQAWSANLFTTVSDTFPKSVVASVVGLGGMAGSLGGILFPLYTGHMLDRYQAMGDAAGGYTVLFMVCGSAYLIAFAVNHVLSPRFEPVVMADEAPSA